MQSTIMFTGLVDVKQDSGGLWFTLLDSMPAGWKVNKNVALCFYRKCCEMPKRANFRVICFQIGCSGAREFNLSLRRSVQWRGTLGGLAGALEDPVWKSDTSHFDRCLHVANRCWRGGGVSRSRGTYRTRTTVASRRSSSSIANSASTRSSLCVTSTPTSTRYSRPSPGWWSCPFRFRIRTPYTTTRSFNLISSTTTILTALVSWNYGSRVILSLFYL